MPRLWADIPISLKRWGERTHRMESIRHPFQQRFWARSLWKGVSKREQTEIHTIA